MELQVAQWFVYQIQNVNGPASERRIENALSAIQHLMAQGWTIDEITQEINDFCKQYGDLVKKIYHLQEIFQNKIPPNNLMKADLFYYHQELRQVPPAPKLVRGEDGYFHRIEEPFYLEMKKRFTMEELLAYWYKKTGIAPNDNVRKQDEGKFKYLLQFYDLDELLFSIDTQRHVRDEKHMAPIRNIFDLEKYMDDAKQYIDRKKNVHRQLGINRVIKKEEG